MCRVIISVWSLPEVRHIFVPVLDKVGHLFTVLTVSAFTLQPEGEPVEGVLLCRSICLDFLSQGLMCTAR